MRDDFGAETQFPTIGSDEWCCLVDRLARLGLDSGNNASRVVAVVALTVVDEVLGLAPGPENH